MKAPPSVTVLGIDCAGAACSAAVLRDGAALARLSEPMSRGQAERIVPMIDDVLRSAQVAPADLGAVAVTVGPGAFTGVRIGLAAALGIARVVGVPCVGVTVPDALASEIPVTDGARLLVALDSRRDDPFCSLYTAGSGRWTGGEPQAVPGTPDAARSFAPEGEGALLVAGDFAARLVEMTGYGTVLESPRVPDPVHVALLGAQGLADGTARTAEPLYLRAPDVSDPSKDRASRNTRGQ